LIVTLTINPAIDRIILADRLVFEDRSYILSTTESAGGRGLNASQVVHSFGGETMAVVIAGGCCGKRFEKLLAGIKFPVEVVPVASEIRTNFAISDKNGLTIKLNEIGPTLSAEEVTAVEHAMEQLLPQTRWLMLCGSLPPGVPSSFYAEIIAMARAAGVPTLLDTDGDALLEGIEASPTVVAPNQQEAERLLNRALLTRSHFIEAVERMRAMGAENVLLSLGSRGAMCAFDKDLIEVRPPRVDAISPIGAGDAMAAAFVWSMVNKGEFADAARWGVAAGTASARLPGISFADLQQTTAVYTQVEVRNARG
jgi:1-phosphofructokinase family hexose kinase